MSSVPAVNASVPVADDVAAQPAVPTDTSPADVFLGLVAPVVCWWINGYADIPFMPAPPRSGVLDMNLGGPLAGLLWLALLMSAMALWIIRRPASPVLAGVLAACGLWALSFGATILPLTIIGLLFGIGMLGLAPFGSAWVCARAARGAWRAVTARRPSRLVRRRLWLAALVTACLPGTVGYATRAIVSHDLAVAVDDPGRCTAARWSRLIVLRHALQAAGDDPARELAETWYWETESSHRAALASAYERLTGEDVAKSARVAELEAPLD